MKYYGKEKCRILKQIRAEIAKQNDIDWVVSECKHQGNCRGTCPKCEQEVRRLEEALARREALGKKVAVVGISAGIALSVTGCANPLTSTPGGMTAEASAGNRPAGTQSVATEQSTAAQTDTDTNSSQEMATEIASESYIEMGEIEVLDGVPALPEDETTMGEPAWPEDDTDMGEPLPETLMGDYPVEETP